MLVRRFSVAGLAAGLATALAGAAVPAAAAPPPAFNRVATFPVWQNTSLDVETVAEIVAATDDGQTLVYTDAAQELLGFVDVTAPSSPTPAGTVALPGEPTSVAMLGAYALAGVNTSVDFVNTSGSLEVVDIASRTIVASLDLGGQPDAVAVSPNGTFAAVAIENERDEDTPDEGDIIANPQAPAGFVVVVDTSDADPANWTTTKVELTGLADLAPTDPEPEFVAINDDDVAVVTLQENNHLVLIDLATANVTADFSAGTVDLTQVDVAEEGVIDLTGTLTDVPREPDAVTWISTTQFATANEGDLNGGSRGFSIFNLDGTVAYDSGNLMEHLAVRHGHYPEHRSENKGTEPEGVTFATFGGTPFLFVNSERGNFVAVFDLTSGTPVFHQFLPTGVGPEGLLALPSRDLFVVASEVDEADNKIRSNVGIYELQDAPATYPQLVSADSGDVPIAWGALSALGAEPTRTDVLYAVTDSAYAETRILTIDTSTTPAVITDELAVTKGGAPMGYDGEGIHANVDGTFWLAQEGDDREGRERDNLLVHIGAAGAVIEEVRLPDAVKAVIERFGFEGVTATGEGADQQVFVAFQRAWEDDPAGKVKVGRYTPATGEWGFFHYALQSVPAGWIGLSEITAVDDTTFVVIERDNQTGPDAATKGVYAFSIAGLEPTSYADAAVTDGTVDLQDVTVVEVLDVLPALRAGNGWIWDKLEGLALSGGQLFAVTDNDGVDDATGETQFLRLGALSLPTLPTAAVENGAVGAVDASDGSGAPAAEEDPLPATGANAIAMALLAAGTLGLGASTLRPARRGQG